MHLSRIRRPLLLRRRHMRRGSGKLAALLIGLAVIVVFFIIVAGKMKPIIMETAVYTVTDEMTKAINNAVAEKIENGSLDYNKLITLEKDSDGNITALVTNMAMVNKLQTEITNEAIEHMSSQWTTKLGIPLGSILGGTFFAGRGPKIPVKILSFTNSSAEFKNRFTAAGINQTHHQIVLHLTVDLEVMIPGESMSATVETDVIVAETVIVGRVPETFAQFDGVISERS